MGKKKKNSNNAGKHESLRNMEFRIKTVKVYIMEFFKERLEIFGDIIFKMMELSLVTVDWPIQTNG